MKQVDVYTVPPKYYVGIRAGDFSTETYPLAFATHFTKDDKDFQKRKGTVDSWCAGYYWQAQKNVPSVTYLDNVPLKGFVIHDWDTRSETQNKWFDIRDPRGFTLQISAKNVVDLLKEVTVVHGVIQDECIWVRYRGQNFLVTPQNQNYKRALAGKVSLKDLKAGDIVFLSGTEMVYMGHKHIMIFNPNMNKDHIYVPYHYDGPVKSYLDAPHYKQQEVDMLAKGWVRVMKANGYNWSYKPYKDKLHVFGYPREMLEKESFRDITLTKSPTVNEIIGHDASYMNDYSTKPLKGRYGSWNNEDFQYQARVLLVDTKEDLTKVDVAGIIKSLPTHRTSGYWPEYVNPKVTRVEEILIENTEL